MATTEELNAAFEKLEKTAARVKLERDILVQMFNAVRQVIRVAEELLEERGVASGE